MSKDNSPSAFPLGASEYGGHGSEAGMTLRDYFAAKAMQTLLCRDHLENAAAKLGADLHTDLPKAAYAWADAMLAARDA